MCLVRSLEEQKLKIYVGNLSFDTTEESLEAAFATYGAVRSVSIIRDRETGKSRGFGFVEMDDDDEASSALSGLNGSQLDSRTVTVNEARPRTGGSGPGGGSGDYGGRRTRW
jgi:RNA recognition motif-containing protein